MPGRSASRRPIPDEIVAAVAAIAPGFGGINLEDISAPRCFEIESRLQEQLDIPVFHDDQHGTAIVVTAAFLNALRLVGKRPEDVRVVLTGVGAAGVATTDMLLGLGVRYVIGCDRQGAIHLGRDDLGPWKTLFAERTNPEGFSGTADEALAGADVFIGLSGPGRGHRATGSPRWPTARSSSRWRTRRPRWRRRRSRGSPPSSRPGAPTTRTRSTTCSPSPAIFRGALDVRASAINEEMKLAAAHAIAAVVKPDELGAEYIVPSVFNRDVAPAVAAAVSAAAEQTGVARRHRVSRLKRPEPGAWPGSGGARRRGAVLAVAQSEHSHASVKRARLVRTPFRDAVEVPALLSGFDAVDHVRQVRRHVGQDRGLLGLGDLAVGDRLVELRLAGASSAVTSPSTVLPLPAAVTSSASVLPPFSAVWRSATEIPRKSAAVFSGPPSCFPAPGTGGPLLTSSVTASV